MSTGRSSLHVPTPASAERIVVEVACDTSRGAAASRGPPLSASTWTTNGEEALVSGALEAVAGVPLRRAAQAARARANAGAPRWGRIENTLYRFGRRTSNLPA